MPRPRPRISNSIHLIWDLDPALLLLLLRLTGPNAGQCRAATRRLSPVSNISLTRPGGEFRPLTHGGVKPYITQTALLRATPSSRKIVL